MRLKNTRIKILSLIILIPILSIAQTNRALMIVIDTYPSNSGWEDIHATNDSLIIIPMLLNNGYLKKDIKILSNEKATKKKIMQSLSDIEKKSSRGDYVYIHFSCHGQQMVDDNGDEADGLDEALIPYDAKRRYTKNKYEGENHLRDDELRKQLELIRYSIGASGNLVVVLDACHSGTGTRTEDEEEYIRGTSYIFAPEGAVIKKGNTSNLNFSHKVDKKLSPITVFSACLDKQINHEYKDTTTNRYYGALSYILSKALLSKIYTESIVSFYNSINTGMKAIFRNKRWEQTPYYETTNKNEPFRLGRNR